MADRETSAEIDDLAAEWAARADAAPLSAPDQAALDAWLAGDTRRLGAYGKARAVLAHMERSRALGYGYEASEFEAQRARRDARRTADRRAVLSGGLAAAAAGIAVIGGWRWSLRDQFSTALGEQRTVPLPDGSTVTLNTASRIAVRYSDKARRVRLLDGEALFSVAKNPDRPFIVEASDAKVRAVGTSFSVRRLDAAVQVVVREGVVEVGQGDTAPVRMPANTRVVATPGALLKPVTLNADETSQALAWRDGMIAFEGETLAQAAAEFARYSEVRVVIDDPRVARKTITGLFAANNPVGFAKAVARGLDLQLQVEPGAVRLS